MLQVHDVYRGGSICLKKSHDGQTDHIETKDSWKFIYRGLGEVESGNNHTGMTVDNNWDTQMWME